MAPLLVVIALIAVMWLMARYNQAEPEYRKRLLRSFLLYGAGAVVLLMAVTGRLHPLFALFSAAVPWINRALAAKRLWNAFTKAHAEDDAPPLSENPPPSPPQVGENLSREQAYEVLGLEAGATRVEIIQAHRKLMQKIHPDHGGTDYLAARINQAKDILLNAEA